VERQLGRHLHLLFRKLQAGYIVSFDLRLIGADGTAQSVIELLVIYVTAVLVLLLAGLFLRRIWIVVRPITVVRAWKPAWYCFSAMMRVVV
jgi:hypothetical protein